MCILYAKQQVIVSGDKIGGASGKNGRGVTFFDDRRVQITAPRVPNQ
jgi:hypothetical protein